VARTRTTAGREDGAADAVDEGLLVASQIDGLAMARHVVGFTPLATVSRAEFIADLAPVFDHYLTGRLNPA
jgi:Tetracyclin repressor-like, C-terminal domain